MPRGGGVMKGGWALKRDRKRLSKIIFKIPFLGLGTEKKNNRYLFGYILVKFKWHKSVDDLLHYFFGTICCLLNRSPKFYNHVFL